MEIENKVVKDGFISLEGGIDSGRAPNLIDRNEGAFAVNTTFRGGFATCRPGWSKVPFTFQSEGDLGMVDGRFQVGAIYAPDTGTAFLSAMISGSLYKITVDGNVQNISITGELNPTVRRQAWAVQAENFLVVQDGQSKPLIFDGASSRRAAQNEVPVGDMMSVVMGRLWVANGREYVAGDIVGGPSGTRADGFRDAILKFTENTYLTEGGTFSLPLQSGAINVMAYTANINTVLGQGELVIGTPNAIFTTIVPPDRATWKTTTQPLQTIAQISFGPQGQLNQCLVNGDLWYRSQDGYRSLIMAVRNFNAGWGNTPMSKEMNRIIALDDPSLLQYGSMVNFDNRMLGTVSPIMTDHGCMHRGVAVLDFDLVSSMKQRSQPAWEGIWTGINVIQLLQGNFDGVSRCFAFALSADNKIELWELSKNAQFDSVGTAQKRIVWEVEGASYPFGDPFGLKQLNGGDITVDRMAGEVDITISFRPDQHPFWTLWQTMSLCATDRKCDLSRCEQPLDYKLQYRPKLRLLQPPDDCNEVLGVPIRNGYEFQPRIQIQGYCRIKQFRMKALVQDEIPTAECLPPESCKALTGCDESPFSYQSE